MFVNSKTNQQSATKTHRDTRNKPLPVINPEPSLEPDTSPLIRATTDHSQPISIQSILSLIKNTQRQSIDNPTLLSSFLAPPPQSNSQSQSHTQLGIGRGQISRLSIEQEEGRRQSSQVLIWREKYEDMLRRYKEGESSFYKLSEKNKQLESEIRYLNQGPQNLLSTRDVEITNLKQQLKTSREVSESNISMLESSNKRLESERGQLRELLEESKREKGYLENQLGLARTNAERYERENQNQSYVKQQLSRSEQQNRRLIQSIASLTDQLTEKERYVQAQLIEYRQNNSRLQQECRRLSDEVLRYKQKALSDSNHEKSLIEKQRELGYQIEVLKTENIGLERSKHDAAALRNQLVLVRSKGNSLEIENNQLRGRNNLNEGKILELESEIRRLQQYRLDNSQILINYESIKREVDESRFNADTMASEMTNRVKLLEREVEYYSSQDRAKDTLIQKLNQQITQLKKAPRGDPDSDLLRKHLELSVDEISRIYSHTRNIIADLTGRVSWLSKEKEEFLKKQQYQQFELEKLYEVLKTRKEELQTCYKTIEGLRKIKDESNSQDLNEILRNRREQLF